MVLMCSTAWASSNTPDISRTPLEALRIPIFIYHSVRPHPDGESKQADAFDITPELLDQQLLYLSQHGFTSVDLDDVVGFLKAGHTGRVAKPVVLTFDDGWRNQYTYAFPLLKRYRMRATFFVFTNPLGWEKHFMTWEQLKEMQQAGMTIGCHTRYHPYLNKQTEGQLHQELWDSKGVIEKHLGRPVKHFAYPFGITNPHLRQRVSEAGYQTARTINYSTFQRDPLNLQGILVSDDLSEFKRIVEGAFANPAVSVRSRSQSHR